LHVVILLGNILK